ncbi:uncharacterized protein VTP21DRAFT_2965 [Calcarisporiella thermophila]|uniref:uncharacterized protein n=1 Tax=Calcarisporiella thermophila TaxID=911321 RepID=UPI0037439F27
MVQWGWIGLCFLSYLFIRVYGGTECRNPLYDSLCSIPRYPDHYRLNDMQLYGLKQYAKLAAMAQCPFKPGELQCAVYSDEFPQVTVLATARAPHDDTYMYIARDDARCAFVLSYRGAVSPIAKKIKHGYHTVAYNPDFVSGARVLKKVYEAFMRLQANTLEYIQTVFEAHPDYKVEVIGHSLGAAFAILMAAELVTKTNIPSDQIVLVTFGEMRIGNQKFVQYLEQMNLTTKRYVYRYDFEVHLMPHALGFRARGHEVWTSGDKNGTYTCNEAEDKFCSRGVPLYKLNAMDHLNAVGLDIDIFQFF